MIIRALTFAGALAGGAGLSQFPEYSQQYQQRLAGAVDEMRGVVARFDDSLKAVGQTREEVFAKEPASDLEGQLVKDGKDNIARLSFLETALARVRSGSIMDQFFAAPAVADSQVAKAAWADFKPAFPLTVVGLAFAGIGFIGGWVLFAVVLGLLGLAFAAWRRRGQPA